MHAWLIRYTVVPKALVFPRCRLRKLLNLFLRRNLLDYGFGSVLGTGLPPGVRPVQNRSKGWHRLDRTCPHVWCADHVCTGRHAYDGLWLPEERNLKQYQIATNSHRKRPVFKDEKSKLFGRNDALRVICHSNQPYCKLLHHRICNLLDLCHSNFAEGPQSSTEERILGRLCQ